MIGPPDIFCKDYMDAVGTVGGNIVCTEGLHGGDINFPPQVDVTSKKLTPHQKKVAKKGSKQPHPERKPGRGVVCYLFLNYLFLLDRRIPRGPIVR